MGHRLREARSLSAHLRPVAAALVGGLVFAVAPAAAQISPGELSAAHAKLDDNRSCLSCHSPEEGVVASLCLDCHRALRARLDVRGGLHASPEFERCERCHSEHNGRAFALVEWPGGREAFDHASAGWPLVDAHARLACERCHRAELARGALARLEPERDPAHSFLGLSTACATCHVDPHRGTLREGRCEECHSQATWKEQRGFRHESTRFPLLGAHARADCAKCHRAGERPVEAEATGQTRVFDQFRGRAATPDCAECHRDPHGGRLGADCSRCHDNESFATVRRGALDHDRTAYPLRGRHREVACARCHTGRGVLRIAGFDRCATCHRDPHAGQLAAAGDCASCHDVTGFAPAHYDLARHSRADFPLEGAHRAVPCSECHPQVAPADLAPRYRGPGTRATRRYRMSSARCTDCHADPHRGELDRYAGDEGCRACHGLEGWRPARFDHSRARFALAGAHGRTECARCHPGDEDPSRRSFAGRPLDCAGCHRDPHAGQFALEGSTDCARCHDTDRFRPLPSFDHARTRFALDGRHAAVACAGCHPAEPGPEGAVVRYRPRPLDCAGCHARPGGRPS